MNRTIKMTKYHIFDNLHAVEVYYIVVLVLAVFIGCGASISTCGRVSVTGMDFATVIFLFIVGLNSFKTSFKFSQANNIARKTYFDSLILSIFPITFGMAAADILLNRISNLFMPSPMMFDMAYGRAANGAFAGVYQYPINQDGSSSVVRIWFQSNDFYTVFSTLFWLFAVYTMTFLVGVFVTMLFYRSSKWVKLVVALSPIWLSAVAERVLWWFPGVKEALNAFFSRIFGVNAWLAVLGYLAIAFVLSILCYLLVRRAPVKD